jgi:hypothetical protein
VSLVGLEPDKLVFARLGREIALNNLMVDPSLSGNETSDARSNKELSSILHGSTCEIIWL